MLSDLIKTALIGFTLLGFTVGFVPTIHAAQDRVACSKASECLENEICETVNGSGFCLPTLCDSSYDCLYVGLICRNETCVECTSDSDCTDSRRCRDDGFCAECLDNSGCKTEESPYCRDDGVCVPCLMDDDCARNEICIDSVCETNPATYVEGGAANCQSGGSFSALLFLLASLIGGSLIRRRRRAKS